MKNFFYVKQLAQIQSLGNTGARTPISHHPSYSDKLDDMGFPQGVSPPPHLNNLHSSGGKCMISFETEKRPLNS